MEYWKEQDAFYKPVEFGLYKPYEVNEKFVAPKGFNPMAREVPVENAAPDASTVDAKYFGLPVNNPMFWLALVGVGVAVYVIMKR